MEEYRNRSTFPFYNPKDSPVRFLRQGCLIDWIYCSYGCAETGYV